MTTTASAAPDTLEPDVLEPVEQGRSERFNAPGNTGEVRDALLRRQFELAPQRGARLDSTTEGEHRERVKQYQRLIITLMLTAPGRPFTALNLEEHILERAYRTGAPKRGSEDWLKHQAALTATLTELRQLLATAA